MKKDTEKIIDNMHKHSHNKEGLAGVIKGLQGTKHFGAKHGARHKTAQSKALNKAQGKSTMPF